MKKRSCRMTDIEKSVHKRAVELRKMTDQKLVALIDQTHEDSFQQGRKAGVEAALDIAKASLEGFFIHLSSKSGTGNGIGAATVKKIKDFAIAEGFING